MQLTFLYTAIYKINNKNLPYSTESYTEYFVTTYTGKESEKG